MSVSTTSTFTCDRDGVTGEGTSDMATVNPPVGWARMNFDEFSQGQGGGASPPVMGHLCPTCVAAFREWMGASSLFGKPQPKKQETAP